MEALSGPVFELFTSAFVATGVSIVDTQHYELLALGEELHVAMAIGNTRTMMKSFLNRVESHLLSHLATEEQIMIMHPYAGVSEHLREHERARNMMRDLQRGSKAGSMPIAFDTMQFLRGWLTPHLNGPDRELFESLRHRRGSVFDRRQRWRSGTLLTLPVPADPADLLEQTADVFR